MRSTTSAKSTSGLDSRSVQAAAAGNAHHLLHAMMTRIEIDQQHLEILLGRDRQREIDRGEGLALARLGAGHHDDAVSLRLGIVVDLGDVFRNHLALDQTELFGDARAAGRRQGDAVRTQRGAIDRDLVAMGGHRFGLRGTALAARCRRRGLVEFRLRLQLRLRRGLRAGRPRLRHRRRTTTPIAIRCHRQRYLLSGLVATFQMRRGAFDQATGSCVHHEPIPPPDRARWKSNVIAIKTA